jgi:hypothetical protein
MKELIDEQIKEMQQMQIEFGGASDLMEQKYRQLNDRFQEL